MAQDPQKKENKQFFLTLQYKVKEGKMEEFLEQEGALMEEFIKKDGVLNYWLATDKECNKASAYVLFESKDAFDKATDENIIAKIKQLGQLQDGKPDRQDLFIHKRCDKK